MKRLSIFWLISLSIYACTDSSIKDGEHEFFYQDGTLKRIINYKNGRFHGEEKIYYPSGNLKIDRQWNHDTLVYDQYLYYDSIVPYLQANYEGDTIISNSPKVKRYSFANNSGEIAYEVNYDEEGNITDKRGTAIVSRFIEPVPAKIENRYNLQYRVATQPFIANRELVIKLMYGEKIIDSTVLDINYRYNLAKYSFVPEDTGKYLVRAIYKQNGRTVLQIDTVDLEIPIQL